jgi:Subtilase family/GEVED domain/Secretion system C-terminal sorting domain/Ig-like domain CHU_C associated
MNNCRIPSLIPSLLLLLVLSGLYSQAQTVTNSAALQSASQTLGRQHAALQQMLVSTANAKGWPLVLRGKNRRMAYLRGINAKGFPVYVTTTDNIISAATIRTNQLWAGGSLGLNLSGGSANMKGKIAVWDEGLVRPTHVELTGRVAQQDGNTTLSDHSTHVSGTMIASGVNPLAKGMSFGAQQLLTYDFDNDESEMAAAAAKGLLISNHSYADIAGWNFNDALNRWEFWGETGDTVDIKFGQYDEDAQTWDKIAFDAPNYLIVKAGGNNPGETGPAVGQTYWRMNSNGVFVNSGARPANISNNDGFNTIATYGDAKNILTLGAVNPIPGGYNQPSDVVLAGFSSLGPSGDGRIKPDVVADGVNVLSSVSTADNAYDIFSGTSMATPATAGSAFLLQEYYTQLHGAASFMRAATLKGLLIHTTDEAGVSPGPDYSYGWGLVNMQRAASVITSDNTDHAQQIFQNSFGSGHDKDSVTIVASGTSPLVATISWTDPPGTPASIPAGSHNFQDTAIKLVNDLDLRITDLSTGKVFFPWILNNVNRSAAATKGDNIRDNVEKVELGDTVVPGHSYKVLVSHKKALVNGTQAYSLLISGGGGNVYCATSVPAASGASITQVTLPNLSNSPGAACRTYTDFTNLSAALLPVGSTTGLTITDGTCAGATNPRAIAVYIDYNNDGVFDPVTEQAVLSPVLSAAGGVPGLSITVPTTAKVGTTTRMRIIVEETSTPSSITPCGAYGVGETQDYRVTFTNPSNDVGVTTLEYPTSTACANDSQIVAVRIHNFGATAIGSGVAVSTVITGSTSLTLNAICKDSIPAGGEVVFTYNTSFPTVPGGSYAFTSKTALAGDLNTSNDGNASTIHINAASPAITGTATICGTNAAQVVLKATTAGIDLPVWYDSPTSSTPIAAGDNTSSSVITANKTYYVGANDLKAKAGPPNKNYYGTAGDYFLFQGNFVKFTTSVPLTIESAKLYVGHAGKLNLTLATLASINRTTGNYSFLPLYNTTIDLYASKLVPQSGQQISVAAGDNTDTGGLYYLNIPVPTPGDYILILDCSDSTNLFLNVNIPTNPYPISIPGIFAVTGNDFYDVGKADSATYFQKFYYPLYDIGIRLSGCSSATRTAVVATTKTSPVISLNGNVLTSNVSAGNQWFLNDSLLNGSTGQTDTVHLPGVYTDVVTDPVTGCILTSNAIQYKPNTSDPNTSIGLTTSPNPSNGVFNLSFFLDTPDNTSITLTNFTGQKVYQADYPNFTGVFSQQINVGYLAGGIYVLKIYHGGNTYTKKILITR